MCGLPRAMNPLKIIKDPLGALNPKNAIKDLNPKNLLKNPVDHIQDVTPIKI